MKKILLFLFLILLNKSVFSYSLFNTSFYNVEFISNNIDDEKIKKINEIKKNSILNILKQTLNSDQFIKLKNNLSDDLINTFVKNVIIEDEKIIENKYLSKIKINFDKKEIIKFYRYKKIPYIEYLPDKILLVIVEENELNYNLFSKNNNFYSFYNNSLKNKNIFKIPNLDINDRYILKKEHIDNRNIKKISDFSKKYSLNDIIFVTAKIINNKALYKLALYSDGVITEKKLNFDKYEFKEFFKILENETINIWKKVNQIQNNSLNVINCNLNYFNMLELNQIRNNFDNVSIIQNTNIKSISYKNIEYDIFFYGNLKLLIKIFNLNQLKINEIHNNCTIRLK